MVIGSGPAGWAAAAACRQEGLTVALVSPDPEAPFRNGYGVWIDEVEGLGLGEVFQRRWPGVRIFFGADEDRSVARAYGRLDNARLRAALRERAAGLELISGRVYAVDAGTPNRVRLEEGGILEAEIVIDASGHESPLLTNVEGPEPGWQVALGWRLEVEKGHPWPLDEAVLMDFRAADPQDPETADWPTFLYVLPEDERTVFVEETVLVSRPRRALEAIRPRLERRLAGRGITSYRILEEERCFIPMGGPPAPPVQSVIAFGGAARMVHPATGYLLARVLRTAPRLGRAVRGALEEGLVGPERAHRVWSSVWSDSERGAHDLARFGMELLLDLDTEATAGFFRAFFTTPPERWQSYLSGAATAGEVRAAMRSVFARAGWGLRLRLAQAGFGPHGRLLRGALFVR